MVRNSIPHKAPCLYDERPAGGQRAKERASVDGRGGVPLTLNF